MTASGSVGFPTTRLKYVTSLRRSRLDASHDERPFVGLEQIEPGTGRLVGPPSFDGGESLSSTFERGDVLFGKLRPYLAKAWVAEFPGRCTTELLVMQPTEAVDAPFLRTVFLSPPFIHEVDSATSGSKMPRAEWSLVGSTPVPLPPLQTQRAIADYVDRETAQLNALVAANDRLLRLLTDKRQALITCGVLRGLRSRVRLRDTGVSWLGRIPAHWQTERARWLFRERDERSETGEGELLTVSHLTGVTPRSEKTVNMFEPATTEGYKSCLPGDLVVNTLWAWMGAMGASPTDGIVSPAYNVYEPGTRLDPDYVDALVRVPAFAHEVARYSKGVWSSRLRLYPEGFFAVSFPVPPLSEQREIVAHLAKVTGKLDELCAATERTLVLLKERRTALIAAAVTGQIDVAQTA